MSSSSPDRPGRPTGAPASDADEGVAFALVDVFGDGPLTGSPVAVVDMTELAAPESQRVPWMKAVAREFNQAETMFVLPPTDGRAHRRLAPDGTLTIRRGRPWNGPARSVRRRLPAAPSRSRAPRP
ncbi:PhzF family phenazine biosynthesis protein [Actinomycetospora sp. CA-053990]|uniref:PhzF family phenazine biosynthesis protein n=1 Tax=Actinomycetospora sp. CA-053990 TaxID=3239891 RepID=UPI003D8AB74C